MEASNKNWKKTQKYVEERVGEAQQQISEQLKGELRGELHKQLKQEVSKQVSRRIDKTLGDGFLKVQKGIQANRLLYGFLVGIGIMLFWYGSWQVIPAIPIINSGPVSLVVGLFLLLISGTLYYKLVGPKS